MRAKGNGPRRWLPLCADIKCCDKRRVVDRSQTSSVAATYSVVLYRVLPCTEDGLTD